MPHISTPILTMAQTKSVPIEDIKIDHERFRIGLGEGAEANQKFIELKSSLERNGQLNPVIVDANMELVAGFRRLSAARALGWKQIEVKIREDLDEYSRREIELEENIMRLDMTWQEEQIAIDELDRLKRATDPNWGQRETAQLLGKEQADISRAKSLAQGMKLFPEIMKAKSKSQALAFLTQKARNINRRLDVQSDSLRYAEIEDKILLGDSTELIKALPDGWIRAIVTDPPFGIDFDKRIEDTIGSTSSYKDDADNYRRLLGMAPELYRVLQPDGVLVWFLGFTWYEEAKQVFRDAGFTVDEIPIVWDRSDGRTFTSRPDRWFGRGYDIALHAVKGNPQNPQKGKSNVLRFAPVAAADKELLVERPVELYAELIRRLTVPGEIVADFFVGSGSCPAAAASLGRDYFGIELDPDRRARAITKIKSYTPDEDK